MKIAHGWGRVAAPRRIAMVLAGWMACQSLVVTAQTQGTDIRSYLTANISSKLSLAGMWSPLDSDPPNGGLVGPFWGIIRTGTSQQESVALGGWVFNGSFASTLPDVTPVRSALFEQQADGKLADATSRLLGTAMTNGAGSVLVADFNGDGRDDLVFPAHNESPFFWKASTAYMSRASGGFDRITLPDNVMAHDARVVTLDGKKKIIARSFGGSGNNGVGPGFNVVYTWSGSNFTVDTSLGDMSGQSVLAGPFTGNTDNWLIIGDSTGGPGVPFDPNASMLIRAYKYNNGAVTLPGILLPKPYFNDKPAYAAFSSFWDPQSKTHTSRLWTTDLNQDGLPDIVGGEEIWNSTSAGLQKAVFQLLINRGNMEFTDETDALAPEFNQDSYIDYSVRFADVDGSGIDTIFHSSNSAFTDSADATKQGQYILVNDGTGRLYAAMHDEFRAMRTQIASFIASAAPGGGTSSAITPQFIAYRTSAGTLNFVAVTRYFNASQTPKNRYALVNVALGINLATDFRRDLTINTRNGSKRIRTFAGNDIIRRALSDPDCSIDGGLGNNTVIYPGNRAAWAITKLGDIVSIRPVSGGGGTDTLTRIQRAQFDDQTVDLTQLSAAPASKQGAWWAGASENGWGLSFVQHGNTLVAGWYYYDSAGRPTWSIMPGCTWNPSFTTCAGQVYNSAGTWFGNYSESGFSQNSVGTVTFSFLDSESGTMSFTVNGLSGTKTISRISFGAGSPSMLTDYSDVWSGGAGQNGWGLALLQQQSVLVGSWYTYDSQGRAIWFLMNGGSWTSTSTYQATLIRATGSPLLGVVYNAASFVPVTAGSITLNFSSSTTGTMTYTVDGVTQTKTISRLAF